MVYNVMRAPMHKAQYIIICSAFYIPAHMTFPVISCPVHSVVLTAGVNLQLELNSITELGLAQLVKLFTDTLSECP